LASPFGCGFAPEALADMAAGEGEGGSGWDGDGAGTRAEGGGEHVGMSWDAGRGLFNRLGLSLVEATASRSSARTGHTSWNVTS
jgi:hypothetical protein